MNRTSNRCLLTGDIGGTKTTLALVSLSDENAPPIASTTYPSAESAEFEPLLERFLAAHPAVPSRATIAVAGPVFERRAQVTNLPWNIDAATIENRFGIPEVILVNDIEALAWAVPHLDGDRLHVLHRGQPKPGGAIAIVAPGTGCGEGFLIWNGERYVAQPSEGGHAGFAALDPNHDELLDYLRSTLDEVFVESICSGGGLPNIYRFLRDVRELPEEAWLADRLLHALDPTPVIVAAALDASSPLCVETLRWFASLLAAESRSAALRLLATGGVFLGGGIPPRILPFLSDGRFVSTFQQEGTLSDVLKEVPLSVILDPQAALHGAARRGRAPR